MNNHDVALPFPKIGAFQPCSYRDEDMNEVEFITKDSCTINGGSGRTYFEPLYSVTGALIGFRLISARFLHRSEEYVSMAQLLWRAFSADIQKTRARPPSKLSLTALYVRGALLLAQHPRAWFLK